MAQPAMKKPKKTLRQPFSVPAPERSFSKAVQKSIPCRATNVNNLPKLQELQKHDKIPPPSDPSMSIDEIAIELVSPPQQIKKKRRAKIKKRKEEHSDSDTDMDTAAGSLYIPQNSRSQSFVTKDGNDGDDDMMVKRTRSYSKRTSLSISREEAQEEEEKEEEKPAPKGKFRPTGL